MKRPISCTLLILSLILYYFAPENYSFGYCLWVHNLFLVSAAFIILLDRRNEKVGFNILFSTSFFFTNFVYPVYIYPIDPSYSLFSFPFNERVISKCTGMAQVAYAAYACGYLWNLQSETRIKHIDLGFFVSTRHLRVITISVLAYFLVFLISGGIDYFEDRYVRGEMSSNLGVQYLIM